MYLDDIGSYGPQGENSPDGIRIPDVYGKLEVSMKED